MGLKSIYIKNGTLWDGESFSQRDIYVREGFIKEIGETSLKDADFIYDAKGKIVSAGLVDIHMHMRGVSVADFGTQAESAAFPHGVTAGVDAGAGLGDKNALEFMALKNVVFSGVAIENNRPNFENLEKRFKLYGDKNIGIKVYFDTANAPIENINPLKEICDYAKERNLKVMVHCTGTPVPLSEVVATLNSGDILTHAYNGSENNAAANDFKSLKEAKERGVIIDAGMAGGVHTDFKVLKAAIEKGATPDAISTDITSYSAHLRGGDYGLCLCMSIFSYLGLPEEKIFASVTKNAAKAVGKENEWGSLKVGGASDIAVFDKNGDGFDISDRWGNHIKSDKGYRCLLTISDGQIVYKR